MDLYLLRTITFWTFIGLGLLSLAYPWRLAGRFSKVALHLPLLMGIVLAVHEWAMPVGLESRPDLLAIITLSGPVFGAYCFRLCVLTGRSAERRSGGKRFEELSWAERTSLLPFNDEEEEERILRLQR